MLAKPGTKNCPGSLPAIAKGLVQSWLLDGRYLSALLRGAEHDVSRVHIKEACMDTISARTSSGKQSATSTTVFNAGRVTARIVLIR